MHIINGYNNIPDIYKNSIIAIGNFDGIHLGHKHLINKVLEVANAEGKNLVLLLLIHIQKLILVV